MANLNLSIKNLVQALNANGDKILYHKKQFMGREGQPHNLYSITRAIWDEDKNRYVQTELYKTTSTIRVVLFLRDMWFTHNGWELPTDNEIWNQMRGGE